MKLAGSTAVLALVLVRSGAAQTDALPAPGFHHLHLNSTDPERAVDFYVSQFSSASKDTFAGQPALKTGKIWVLFNKVSKAPPIAPQTAIWHFGWNVPDERAYIARYRETKTKILPLFTGNDGIVVELTSDTYPYMGGPGIQGSTKAQVEEAKAKGIKPVGGGGVGYIGGPEGAIIEFAGNFPAERFNHVHMYQDDPVCAMLWYQKHLNAPVRRAGGPQGAPPTEATCKVARTESTSPSLDKGGTYRFQSGGVTFDDIAMNWYMNPGDRPLVGTRGQLYDHVALSVANLDAWLAKLKGEGVKILMEPYKLGDARAFMIEGPSKEALELVDVK
jgi:catechol 2,3-dioxygenase-like lactoylglutathione lyase family enzyme